MTLTSKTLKIGARNVGDGQPCFVIAEIGSNHNQDFDLALKHIDAAAEAGVDAVKFQTFRAVDHYSTKTPGFSYLNGVDTHALIKSLEIDRSWHAGLLKHANDRGVEFFSSPCDSDAIQELAGLGVPAYKVASFDLTDVRLVSEMAAVHKPLILSTGMATWMDIQVALDAAHAAGNHQLVLLQCTSLYPAPAHLSNLRAMASMRAAFGTLVGYSDHTNGNHVSLASVAMGGCMIEKHFTLDRTLPGPDHAFACEPYEFRALVTQLREIEAGMGDGIKDGPRAEEREMAEKGRRSLHAARPIARGETITVDSLVAKRPGLGIPPMLMSHVVGRVARQAIDADQWITWDMI